jgi:hypothetical protein
VATVILDLYFQQGNLGPSSAQVTMKEWTSTEKGLPLMTPEAASLSEFEGYINQMQRDLHEIRKRARQLFGPAG